MVRIIHSGLLPDSMKASISFRRLEAFLAFSSDGLSASSARCFSASAFRSIAISRLRTASAPISAVKPSSPNSS